MGQWYSNPNPAAAPATQKTGVGKYLAAPPTTTTTTRTPLSLGKVTQESAGSKRKRPDAKFGDFSGW